MKYIVDSDRGADQCFEWMGSSLAGSRICLAKMTK